MAKESPARAAAAVIPHLQEHGMESLGCSPRLECALLLICTVDFPARSCHTPGSTRLSIYEPPELKAGSIPLGC